MSWPRSVEDASKLRDGARTSTGNPTGDRRSQRAPAWGSVHGRVPPPAHGRRTAGTTGCRPDSDPGTRRERSRHHPCRRHPRDMLHRDPHVGDDRLPAAEDFRPHRDAVHEFRIRHVHLLPTDGSSHHRGAVGSMASGRRFSTPPRGWRVERALAGRRKSCRTAPVPARSRHTALGCAHRLGTAWRCAPGRAQRRRRPGAPASLPTAIHPVRGRGGRGSGNSEPCGPSAGSTPSQPAAASAPAVRKGPAPVRPPAAGARHTLPAWSTASGRPCLRGYWFETGILEAPMRTLDLPRHIARGAAWASSPARGSPFPSRNPDPRFNSRIGNPALRESHYGADDAP